MEFEKKFKSDPKAQEEIEPVVSDGERRM